MTSASYLLRMLLCVLEIGELTNIANLVCFVTQALAVGLE